MEQIKQTIDNRQVNKLTIDSRSIDTNTTKVKQLVGDSELGERYIAHAIKKLGLGNVISIAEYVRAKANHPGKAFIGLCQKEMGK